MKWLRGRYLTSCQLIPPPPITALTPLAASAAQAGSKFVCLIADSRLLLVSGSCMSSCCCCCCCCCFCMRYRRYSCCFRAQFGQGITVLKDNMPPDFLALDFNTFFSPATSPHRFCSWQWGFFGSYSSILSSISVSRSSSSSVSEWGDLVSKAKYTLLIDCPEILQEKLIFTHSLIVVSQHNICKQMFAKCT